MRALYGPHSVACIASGNRYHISEAAMNGLMNGTLTFDEERLAEFRCGAVMRFTPCGTGKQITHVDLIAGTLPEEIKAKIQATGPMMIADPYRVAARRQSVS